MQKQMLHGAAGPALLSMSCTMNLAPLSCLGARWLVCLLVIGVLFAAPIGIINSSTASEPAVVAATSPPLLFGGLLDEVISNRTRLIQVSFIFIVVGIFILWKK